MFCSWCFQFLFKYAKFYKDNRKKSIGQWCFVWPLHNAFVLLPWYKKTFGIENFAIILAVCQTSLIAKTFIIDWIYRIINIFIVKKVINMFPIVAIKKINSWMTIRCFLKIIYKRLNDWHEDSMTKEWWKASMTLAISVAIL